MLAAGCWLILFAQGAFGAVPSAEQITRAQSLSDVKEIMKIARELAEEILTAPLAPPRVTATVVGLYRKAEALDPKALTAEDAGRLGRMYLLLSESYADEAKRYLERSVGETENPDDLVALGNVELYLGDAASARRDYLKVSERRPKDPVILVNLAMAERALGDTASAYGRLRQVMMKPATAAAGRVAALAVADIQIASRDVAGAKIEVQKILQKWPNDLEALTLLKRIYEKEGQDKLAKEIEMRLTAMTGNAGGSRQNKKGEPTK